MKVEFSVSGNDPKGRGYEDFLREYRDKLQGRAAEGEKVTLNDAAAAVFYQGVSRVRATTNYKPKAKKAEAKNPAGPLARKKAAAAAKRSEKKAKAPKVKKAAKEAKPPGVIEAASTPAPAVLD